MSKSKFIEYNKYITDYDFAITTVTMWHKAFNYSFETRGEDMKSISQNFKECFKYTVEYSFQDYNDENVIAKYGISKETALYIKSYAPREFKFIFNKYTSGIMNRFLMLKAYAYIWQGRIDTGHDLRITVSSTGYPEDEIAEHIAIEFLIPKWKLKLLSKNNNFSDECFLANNKTYLNKELYDLSKKWSNKENKKGNIE